MLEAPAVGLKRIRQRGQLGERAEQRGRRPRLDPIAPCEDRREPTVRAAEQPPEAPLERLAERTRAALCRRPQPAHGVELPVRVRPQRKGPGTIGDALDAELLLELVGELEPLEHARQPQIAD